jgi:hypothetical protein
LKLLGRLSLPFSSPDTGLESAKDLLLHKQLPNKNFLSYNSEISSQTAKYNHFSVKFYFRGPCITGQ